MATSHSAGAKRKAAPTVEPRRRQFLSIQYLRGCAALLVVFYHVRNPVPGMFNPIVSQAFGYRGVDIFFVISGFIMFAAARDEPVGIFIRRRIIRIVPLYWTATLMLALVLCAAGKMDGAHAAATIRSLLFVPTFSADVPGVVMPLLDPGWTLNYEMFFYAIFAIGLLTRRIVATTCIILLALVGLGLILQPRSAIGITYTDSLLLEFLAGLLIGAAVRRYPLRRLGLLLPLGFAALVGLPDGWTGRLIVAGLPAAAIVAGAVSLDVAGRVPRVAILKQLGDASFSIYLSHYFVLRALIVVWRHLPLHGWAQFLSYTAAAMLGSVAVGLIVYARVERPLGKAVGHAVDRRRITLAAA